MLFPHGGEIIAQVLKQQGIDVIYTLCGGHVALIYDGCLNHDIDVIDFRHEQAAAHAADAYARLTRNVGIAVVTAGPGVTDAVTGVANAYQARSPMILIGGAASLKDKGKGALQEMPQVDMFKTFTKASFTIETTESIPEKFAEAFRIALSGRPGPVFIELPFDVLFNFIDPPAILEKVEIVPVEPDTNHIQAMFEILRNAKKPLLIAGTQVYWDEAHDVLLQLTEQTNLPVFTNGGGRGTLPMNHPNCFKLSRSQALKQADAVVLIGVPMDFRLKYGEKGWNENAKLIQIEQDEADLNQNRTADVATVANSKLVLEALSEGLQGIDYSDWLYQVRENEDSKLDELNEWMAIDTEPINHFRFSRALQDFIDEDCIVIGDGGDIVSAAAKAIDITLPGQWLDPGPLGCLGVGVPFAIAAQHLYPDKKVLVINGDGAFGLNGFEFDTAVRFKLPIVSIVGNDAGWGQIRVSQVNTLGEERAIATSLSQTQYNKVVEALGGYGEHITDADEIIPALKRAFDSGLPACINVPIDPRGISKTSATTPYVV